MLCQNKDTAVGTINDMLRCNILVKVSGDHCKLSNEFQELLYKDSRCNPRETVRRALRIWLSTRYSHHNASIEQFVILIESLFHIIAYKQLK